MDRSKRIGDAAYRIPFRENADRSAITAAEFQGGPDSDMLGRTRGYTDAMLADFRRRGVLRDGEHPLVRPFVIHTGTSRWSADDGTEPAAGLSAEAVREVALWQPQAYIAMGLGGDALALRLGQGRTRSVLHRVAPATRLVTSSTPPALVELLQRERRRFAGPAELAFRQGMHAWVEEAVLGAPDSDVALPSFEELEDAKEAEMTYLFKDKVDRFKAENREEAARRASGTCSCPWRSAASAPRRAGRWRTPSMVGRVRGSSRKPVISFFPAKRRRSSSAACRVSRPTWAAGRAPQGDRGGRVLGRPRRRHARPDARLHGGDARGLPPPGRASRRAAIRRCRVATRVQRSRADSPPIMARKASRRLLMRSFSGFCVGLILLTGAACDRGGSNGEPTAPASPPATQEREIVDRLDPRLDALLAADATVERVADGFEFIEGPVWVGGADDGHLLFSDIPGDTVYRWSESEGTSVFLNPVFLPELETNGVGGSNGLTLDLEDRLVLCEHGNRRVARIEGDGSRITLADRYDGKRLNSPNDIVYHSSGAAFFTDPPYGLASPEAGELGFQGIYRLDADGTVTLLADGMSRPNGIGLSPDETTLYVANSDVNRVWMAYPVAEDLTVGDGHVLLDLTASEDPGAPDGFAVDTLGNIWASGPGGVVIISPDGDHLGTIRTPELPANAAFGNDGHTLYMTARTGLYRIDTLVQGIMP